MIRARLFRNISEVRNVTFFMMALAAVTAASCEQCGGGTSRSSSGVGGGGGGWLVGEGALMINVPHDPSKGVGHYRLDVTDDLLGIACRGTTDAWVVGNAGLLLSTNDAGVSWRVMDPGVTTSLRGVALAAPDTVYIAGDEGVARVTVDGGRTWKSLTAPGTPALRWTSIATRKTDGAVALLAAEDGALYRYEAGSGWIGETGRSDRGALRSVVLGRDGNTAVAVGDGGAMLVSNDGGRSWRTRDTGTTGALRDVWLTGDKSDQFVAVGDDGLVLEGAVGGTGIGSRSLGAGLTLRALHLEASGHGTIVGDRGAIFLTDDFGTSWERLEIDESRNVLGVDALDAGPHL
jgi:photosystem II stability/assembly factor-like uncharacterized protein